MPNSGSSTDFLPVDPGMSPAFISFSTAVRGLRPRAALVLGSGLAAVAQRFEPGLSISTSEIPGYPPPSVSGHRGELAVGNWSGVPVVISYGRIHAYEGHPSEVLTRPVRMFADWGIPTLILTNAAGGIRPGMPIGSLMPIRRHLKWLAVNDWKSSLESNMVDSGPVVYSPELLARVEQLAPKPRTVVAGCYAALTGPCYETPAEIRALARLGADAVGMSTAIEAEAAVAAGMEVLAIDRKSVV